MIARDSTSYPYLAIAQHYAVPYAEVLEYADYVRDYKVRPPYADWRLAVWLLEKR